MKYIRKYFGRTSAPKQQLFLDPDEVESSRRGFAKVHHNVALRKHMSELGSGAIQNDDDFYGDQDVTRDTEVARQKREVDALRRHHFNAGLREGASDARDATLQGGFDRGFAAGAKATAEPGFMYVFHTRTIPTVKEPYLLGHLEALHHLQLHYLSIQTLIPSAFVPGTLSALGRLGACSVLDAFYSKNESKNITELTPDKREEREALQQDLAEIRESSKRLRVWLRASAVQSKMDVHELGQICGKVVPLEIPDYPAPETVELHQSEST